MEVSSQTKIIFINLGSQRVKMSGLIYPVYFVHVLTSMLIYVLSIFIAPCTDITTTKMSLSCTIALVRAATCLVGASFWSSLCL